MTLALLTPSSTCLSNTAQSNSSKTTKTWHLWTIS